MQLPWISRTHHEETGVLCGRIISDRDKQIKSCEERIKKLEDQNLLLLDALVHLTDFSKQLTAPKKDDEDSDAGNNFGQPG